MFWVDAWDQTLYSWSEEKQERRTVSDLSLLTDSNPIYGLIVHGSALFISSWNNGSLLTGKVFNGPDESELIYREIFVEGLSTDVLFSMASLDASSQFQSKYIFQSF